MLQCIQEYGLNYRYIDSDKALKDYLQLLKEQPLPAIAIDIEGEYNLHCYGEHLCLVQIYDSREYILIDPLTVNIQLIKNLLEDPKILKIFYDCSGDRTLLYRKYSIEVRGIFDLMAAVELLDFPKKNLNMVLHEELGLELKAKKKFQQYNWMQRPISEEALLYAIEDVQYLFDLKDQLMTRIIEQKLLDSFILKNTEYQTRPISKNSIPGVLKKPRFRKMSSQKQDQFKAIFSVREGIAKKINWPANSVLSNENLFKLVNEEFNSKNIPFPGRLKDRWRKELQKEIDKILKP